jgi:hypothetical protein
VCISLCLQSLAREQLDLLLGSTASYVLRLIVFCMNNLNLCMVLGTNGKTSTGSIEAVAAIGGMRAQKCWRVVHSDDI